ncbi:MAG: CinA family protein [Christensenellaceae bacterium]|jgi:nicotinamide-nucleotide amidase|nr:CinA family protein [Christensenellaceae bacterium]
MNISILTVSNSEVISTAPNSALCLVASTLHKSGFNIAENNHLSVDAAVTLSNLTQAYEHSDCVILAVQDQIDYAYVLKKTVAKYFEDEVVPNIYAKNALSNYYKAQNVPLPKDALSHAQMPKSARAILNDLGPMQGFLMEKQGKLLFFMPYTEIELKDMFIKSVLPYLIENTKERSKTIIFKLFGLTQNEILSILKDLRKNKQKINIICSETLLDCELIIDFSEKTEQIVIDGLVSTIYKRLGNYIYADSDISLPECLLGLLNVKNNSLVCAEDATCGAVSAGLLAAGPKAAERLVESFIVPNKNSKIKNLGVDADLFRGANVDANEVVYQMAVGALENSSANFVVATFSKGDTLYLGIGTTDGIHVYTQNFKGLLKERISKFSSAAYFNLIKKIKKNDFNLPQNVVQ